MKLLNSRSTYFLIRMHGMNVQNNVNSGIELSSISVVSKSEVRDGC